MTRADLLACCVLIPYVRPTVGRAMVEQLVLGIVKMVSEEGREKIEES